MKSLITTLLLWISQSLASTPIGDNICIGGPMAIPNCAALKTAFPTAETGVYKLSVGCSDASCCKEVYCQMDLKGGGWTVFQRRFNGTVEFHRNWADYEKGFGYINGEHWLGLSSLSTLLTGGGGPWDLLLTVDEPKNPGCVRFQQFDGFSVGDAASKYKLSLGNWLDGNLEYAPNLPLPYLEYYINGLTSQNFSTFDRDNDNDGGANCAAHFNGGWWYMACHRTHLNGLYSPGCIGFAQGISVVSAGGFTYSFAGSMLAFRPSGFPDEAIPNLCGPTDTDAPSCNGDQSAICNFKTRSSSHHLVSHILHIHAERRLPCPTCKARFPSQGILLEHQTKAHNTAVCDSCGCKFKSPFVLARHVQNAHSKEPSYNCNSCNAKYKHINPLKAHISGHLSSRKKFYCDSCRTCFSTKTYFTKHFTTDHQPHETSRRNAREPPQKVPCPLCSSMLSNQTQLKVHTAAYHRDTVFRVCDQCDYSTRNTRNLLRHMRSVHEKAFSFAETQTIYCDFCLKPIRNRRIMTRHLSRKSIRENMRETQRNFPCSACSSILSSRLSLRSHSYLYHKDVQLKICDQCDHKTKILSNLLKHVNHVHGNTSVAPNLTIYCDVCLKPIRGLGRMTRHLSSIHGNT